MPAGIPVGTLAIGEAGRDQRRPAGRRDPGAGGRRGSGRAARRLARARRPRGRRDRPAMPERRAEPLRRPAPRSASSAAASSAACSALAAARLGFAPTSSRPDADGPAFDVAAATTVARLRRRGGAGRFAAAVDVVTYEFENVPVETAAPPCERWRRCGPARAALRVAQDRLAEKAFLAGARRPVAPSPRSTTPADWTRRSPPSAARGPEDAPARLRRQGPGAARRATRCRRRLCAALGAAPLDPGGLRAFGPRSRSIAARGVAGERRGLRPAVEHAPRAVFCAPRSCPRALPAAVAARPRAMRGRSPKPRLVGVLARRAVLPRDGSQAARQRDRAAGAQLRPLDHRCLRREPVRAAHPRRRGLPLGATGATDAEMDNLIGDEATDWPRLVAEPGARLHLYGKRQARPGRKMGHVNRRPSPQRPLSGRQTPRGH